MPRSARVRHAAAAVLVATTALAALVPAASAHVKWFSRFSYTDAPRAFADVLSARILALAVLAAAAIGGLVALDRRIEETAPFRRLGRWLEARRDAADGILRAAAGASLLLSWSDGALLAQEIAAPAWAGWLQFVAALLLVFGTTVPAAGTLILVLVGVAVAKAGAFHMLDYAVFAGVGYALAVSRAPSERLRASGLPALYATTGFSLMWLAIEKLVYPEWAGYVLQQNPALTLGLDPSFFLDGAAFVELTLGFLLLIGLLERPLSVLVTLVFFSSTLVFGRQEIVGHTILHGALVVFLLMGKGTHFTPPYRFHRQTGLRVAFAAVNFLVVTALLIAAYTGIAARAHARAVASGAATHDASPDPASTPAAPHTHPPGTPAHND